METTIVNPRRRRRTAKRKTSRRRNVGVAAALNPRHRRAPKRRYRRRNPGNPCVNPRRRRGSVRRNPAGFDLGRFAASGLGVLGMRLALRKIGGVREAVGDKLSNTHLLVGAAGIYMAPSIAEWVGADAAQAAAAQDGASAIMISMLIDQWAKNFSSAHLLNTQSVPPTGATEALLGTSPSNPMSKDDYGQLAGLGQLPQGGAYVRAGDGSVWWLPTPVAGELSGDMGAEQVQLPDNARIGSIIKDRDTGSRFRVGQDEQGAITLYPIEGVDGDIGASAVDEYAKAVF